MAYKEAKKLDDKYNASAIEERCIRFWNETKAYQYNAQAPRDNTYIVDTPPPTVSGSLHIGHIFSYTQTDVMVRYKRMLGHSIFYPIGWDDNGLPTERRVQNYYKITCNPTLPYDPDFKPLHNPKESRKQEVSRQNFIEACEQLTEMDEKAFEDVFRKIGHSYDWDLKYSTISPNAIKISQESFLDLVKKGYVDSVEAPTMWDTTFQSAVATAEIEDRETAGHFHDIEFKVDGVDDTFIIATTRPELLPACIAVVAHPDDNRYKHLFGKNAIVPLFDIPVPIVPSEHAEIDKGTGIMMVCTFGDAADVAWWKKSGLPIKQIIGLDGRMLPVQYGEGAFVSEHPAKAAAFYNQLIGLKPKQAREKIVEFLREDGALKGDPKPLVHPVKFYEKGDQPLEFVSSRQWFIKLTEHKEALIEAGRKIKWYPSHMQIRYETWVDGLNQDWCISRQRFFGVPFPVWYPLDAKGEIDYAHPIFATNDQLPVDPMTDTPTGFDAAMRDKPNGFTAEKDVMDTWATSSLTPQIAASTAPQGAPIGLPFDVRPQAHDIIRTWAFYTIAKAWLHEKKLPWKEAFISGFILDPDRKKMSKSVGNVITPMDVIEKYSSDSVRYWAARARLGIDTAYEEQIMDQGKKLAMKLFNASRFVFTITEQSKATVQPDYIKDITDPLDLAWKAKMESTIEAATNYFAKNEYAGALEQTEKCFWNFCDNYLEIVKERAYNSENPSAVATLMYTIDTFLSLFAPFCPYITEEVYQCRPWGETKGASLHVTHWPKTSGMDQNTSLYDDTVAVVEMVRKTKADAKRSLRTTVIDLVIAGQSVDTLKLAESDIKNVTKAQKVEFVKTDGTLSVEKCELEPQE